MPIKQRPMSIDEATKPVMTDESADVQAWHDEQTRQAIKEADAGNFATAEELRTTIRKYVPHG